MTFPPPCPPEPMDLLRQALRTHGVRFVSMLSAGGAESWGEATLEAVQKNLPLLLDELLALLPQLMGARVRAAPGDRVEWRVEQRLDVVVKVLNGLREACVLEISRLKDAVGEEFLRKASGAVRQFFDLKAAGYCLEFVGAQEGEMALRAAQLGEASRRLDDGGVNAPAAWHSRKRLLQGITHELRNSLQAVLLHAAALREEAGEPGLEEVQERLALNACHLGRLLERVRSYEPLLSGDVACEMASVDVGGYLKDLERRHHVLARAGQTRLTCRVAGEVRKMTTDARLLNVVVDNLVSNAIESAPCGWVEVEISKEGGDVVQLKVTDSGRGMSLEEGRRVFQVIHRAPLSMSHGLNLGLLVSRYVAQVLGGEISFQSETGRGACFVVRVPQVSPEG